MATREGAIGGTAALCCALVLAAAAPATAAPGDLDPGFGTGGRVAIDILGTDFGFGGALQADGRILITGSVQATDRDVGIARLTPAGVPDPMFGGGSGHVVTDPSPADNDFPQTVTVQPDGKPLVGGYFASGTTADAGLVRYRADGLPDAGFGTAGVVKWNLGGRDQFGGGALVLPDNRLLWFGRGDAGVAHDLDLVRFWPNGTTDSSFGNGAGIVTHSLRSGSDTEQYETALVQPDGKLLVGGEIQRGANGLDWAIARLHPDGSFDTSFNGDGRLATHFSGSDFLYGLALQPDGKIVAVGGRAGAADAAVARYLPDGSLDPSFSGDGRYVIDLAGDETARAVVVEDDGKIAVAGETSAAGTDDMFVARLLPGGSPDPGFGVDGTTFVDFDGGTDEAHGLLLQPDGKLVAVGWAIIGSSADFAAIRLEGDPVAPGDGGDPAQPPDPAPPAAPEGLDATVTVRIAGKRARMRRRVARVKVVCPRAEQSPPCRGAVRLRTRRKVRFRGNRRKVVLGRARFALEAGGRKRVRLRLTRRKAALLRRSRRARRTVARARVADAAGNRTTVRKRLRVVPPRRR